MNYLNLFICTLELILLQWNKFREIYGNYRLYIKLNVIIETKQLFVKNNKSKKRVKIKIYQITIRYRLGD